MHPGHGRSARHQTRSDACSQYPQPPATSPEQDQRWIQAQPSTGLICETGDMPDEPEANDVPGAPSLDGAKGIFWFEGGPQKRGTLYFANNDLKVITEGIARQPQSYRFHTGDGHGWGMDCTDTPEDAVADYAP